MRDLWTRACFGATLLLAERLTGVLADCQASHAGTGLQKARSGLRGDPPRGEGVMIRGAEGRTSKFIEHLLCAEHYELAFLSFFPPQDFKGQALAFSRKDYFL